MPGVARCWGDSDITQLDVPPIRLRWRSIPVGLSANPPSTARVPACASMMPAPTRQDVVSPSSRAACGVSGPRSLPMGLARAGRWPRSIMSGIPTISKKSGRQPCCWWPMKVHLQVSVHCDRSVDPEAFHVRKSARSKKWPAAFQVSGIWRLSHISFGVSISGDITPPMKSSTA